MDNPIKSFSIREVFSSGDYIIPVYQRNYAWGEPEVTQLIQDIYDYAVAEKRTTNYYIGTLVVYERYEEGNKLLYETIDGQQRLTTLTILVSALNRMYKGIIKNEMEHKLNLFFDSRKKSTQALEIITRDSKNLQEDPSKEYNPEIIQAYKDIEKVLSKKLRQPADIVDFYEYLADKVHVMRVSVPSDTDLNHYFEIMNTRGEQLEKHEILKAKMLEVLKNDEALTYTFNLVWEACADMERYVQYGFNVKQRDRLFAIRDWNCIMFSSLEEVSAELFSLKNAVGNKGEFFKGSIIDALEFKRELSVEEGQKEDSPERFSSIVNFSNFLLHVLRVQTAEDISLDDKRLLDIFDSKMREFKSVKAKRQFVLDFGYNLLWTKWLFDNYIIKREFTGEKDQWSLKRLKWYKGRGNENRVNYVNTFGAEEESDMVHKELVMLLSMFHVSTPTMVYKNWLNAALYYLFYRCDFSRNEPIDAGEYTNYLQSLAKSFLFDRYLAADDHLVEFYDIVYMNDAESVNEHKTEHLDLSKLNTGTSVENFIFNYLDYLLWKKQALGFNNLEFSSARTSVEHYYPQNPIAIDSKIDQSICDNFGNLCLVSSSKNSRLSNNLPSGKKDYYEKVGADSIKQGLMMQYRKWEEAEILKHGEEMVKLLLSS